MIFSVLVIALSIFFMVLSEMTFDVTMENSGSSLTLQSLDENAQGGAHFAIQRTFFDEIWFGVLGLFSAWGLKNNERFAWKLGLVWSVMILSVGVVMSIYQVGILGWTNPCIMMISLILSGGVSLTSLYRVKKIYD